MMYSLTIAQQKMAALAAILYQKKNPPLHPPFPDQRISNQKEK
jgi:hypothetical protein